MKNQTQHSTCTVPRIVVVTHGTLNLATSETKVTGSETVTGPCNTPLFSDDEKSSGICRACATAWEVEGNKFAGEPFQIIHDTDCAEDCGADLANISVQFDKPTKQFVAFVVHDTIGETTSGEMCYGASFQLFAQGKTEIEVTRKVATGHYNAPPVKGTATT